MEPIFGPAPAPPRQHKVPPCTRRKLQTLLLLRHNEVGINVVTINDEYKRYFGEEIRPEQFGFTTWQQMLLSMPDEIILKRAKGVPRAFPQPLTQDVTREFLENIFPPPIVIPERNNGGNELRGVPVFADLLNELMGEDEGSQEEPINPADVDAGAAGVPELPKLTSHKNNSETSSKGDNENGFDGEIKSKEPVEDTAEKTCPNTQGGSGNISQRCSNTTVKVPDPVAIVDADTSHDPSDHQPGCSKTIYKKVIGKEKSTLATTSQISNPPISNGITKVVDGQASAKDVNMDSAAAGNLICSGTPAGTNSSKDTPTEPPPSCSVSSESPVEGIPPYKMTAPINNNTSNIPCDSLFPDKVPLATTVNCVLDRGEASGSKVVNSIHVHKDPPENTAKITSQQANLIQDLPGRSSTTSSNINNSCNRKRRRSQICSSSVANSSTSSSPVPLITIDDSDEEGTYPKTCSTSSVAQSVCAKVVENRPVADGPVLHLKTSTLENPSIEVVKSEPKIGGTAITPSSTTTTVPQPTQQNPASITKTSVNSDVPVNDPKSDSEFHSPPAQQVQVEPEKPRENVLAEAEPVGVERRSTDQLSPLEIQYAKSCQVKLKRLEPCEIAKIMTQVSLGRKRKIRSGSEQSESTESSGRPSKLTRNSLSELASIPSVDELAIVIERLPELWYTTKFKEDIDGDECLTFRECMEYTELYRPPEVMKSESYVVSFTQQYYFIVYDEIDSQLNKLDEIRRTTQAKEKSEYALNPVANLHTLTEVEPDFEIAVDEGGKITVPMMNFEAFQMMNLDADSFISDVAGAGDQLTVLCSYGNFADYFLWRFPRNCRCIGFVPACAEGLAMLHKAPGVTYENFDCYEDGAVDIFEPDSTENFLKYVNSNYIVDLFVASGIGWGDMSGRPQDLALVQSLLALQLLRERGSFILKVEDTFTDFSAGLLFYLSRCFSFITIVKPVSARPWERFILCREKRSADKCARIKEHLQKCHNFRVQNNWEQTHLYTDKILGGSDGSPTSSWLSELDKDFLARLKMWNTDLAALEIQEYELSMKSRQFASVTTQNEQYCLAKAREKVRNLYLLQWMRTLKSQEEDDNSILNVPLELAELLIFNEVRVRGVEVDPKWKMCTVDHWKAIFSSSPKMRHFIRANGEIVSKWHDGWQPVEGLKLPDGTFLYAEIFPPSKSRAAVLNIIDVQSLGHIFLGDKPYNQRIEECACELNKAAVQTGCLINFPQAFELRCLPTVFLGLAKNDTFKSSLFKTPLPAPSSTKNGIQKNSDLTFSVKGVLFLRDKLTQRTPPAEEYSDFRYLMTHRLLWDWEQASSLTDVAMNLIKIFGDNADHKVVSTKATNLAQELCFFRLMEYLASN